MDTKHLYYALEIAELKSISKAAEKLYLAQPTLSGHINKLESHIGCKLFDRTTIPLRLTYEGEIFMDYASKIVETEKKLLHHLQSSSSLDTGRLILGIPPCYSTSLLPKIIPLFKIQFPNIELQLVEESSATLEGLLDKGAIHLAILNLPIDHRHLLYETLLIDHIILAIPNSFLSSEPTTCYPLSSQSLLHSIVLKHYKDSPFLLLKPGHHMAAISQKILEAEHISPNIYIESNHIDTLCELCLLGHGITFVPQTIAFQKFNVPNTPVSLFDLPCHPTDYSLVALYNKNFPPTPSMKYLIQLIRSLNSIS